jgi:hypothetical protein
MPIQLEFDFDGCLVTPGSISQTPAQLALLSEMLSDPEIPTAQISKQIAIQMVRTIRMMKDVGPLRRSISQRQLNDEIKALRILQRTLTDGDSRSRKDTLNMDGPKFRHLLTELIRLFQLALAGAGSDEELARTVMLQFGDLIKSHDEELRQEVGKIGTRSETRSSYRASGHVGPPPSHQMADARPE